MSYSVHQLYTVAESMGVRPLNDVARQPDMRALFRLTIKRRDMRLRDSVATLCHARLGGTMLEVVYWGLFKHKPLTYTIANERYEALAAALQNVRFDKLPDQPGLPQFGVDLWLLERAAGSFVKGIILTPDQLDLPTDAPYAALVRAVQTYISEAVRELQ
jgi:hypothetical protein